MSGQLMQNKKNGGSTSLPANYVWVLIYEAGNWPNGVPFLDKRYGIIGVFTSFEQAQLKGNTWLNERRWRRLTGQSEQHQIVAFQYDFATILGMNVMVDQAGQPEWQTPEGDVRTRATRVGNDVLRVKIEKQEVLQELAQGSAAALNGGQA